MSEENSLDDLLAQVRGIMAEQNSLVGKNVVVTGKLYRYTRAEVVAVIAQRGGHAANAVTNKTAFLVCGERPGSVKVKAAITRRLPIVPEEDFYAMLKSV